MKWYYVAAAIVVLLCILHTSDASAKPKGQVGRIVKEGCFNVDVMDEEHFGDPVPCDDEEPSSTMDYTEPVRAGGAVSGAGFSINPTGAGVYVTYDKS